MRKIVHSCLLLLIATIFGACNRVDNMVTLSYKCPVNRFTTEQFAYITSTVPYTSATNYRGQTQNLQMDINLPADDTLARRPLIIYCHGGGFTSGTRNGAWANKFCQSFAKRGYVTASIDYRLGIGNLGDVDVISAQIRAVQDAKAAVRFFKQTAMEQGNPYRIDTAQIYIAGESSGAIVALQMGYLTSRNKFSEITDAVVLDNLNGIEGTTTLPYSSRIAGVISLSGAMLAPDWVTPGGVPVIMVHGSNDAVIPYHTAIVSPYTGTPLYGSFSIDSAAKSQNVGSSLHVFTGQGTAPYISSTKYADSTIKYVAQELYGLIDCQRLGRR